MPSDSNRPSPVGLVGVGLLGSAIAERLLAVGYQIIGCDLDAARRDALVRLGGAARDSAAEVFSQCEVVLLCLPTSAESGALIEAAGAAAALHPGQVLVDMTTGEPEAMAALGTRLAKQGVSYVEATVAGSSEQARRGEAVLFLGGDDATLAELESLFGALASARFHLGPVGAGSSFKLVHNLLLGLQRAALAETLAFAESLGFDAAMSLQILRQTPAAARVMETKGDKMVSGDYQPQARLAQHLKDVRLILAQAEKSGAMTPLSSVHRALLERAIELGWAEADNSAIIEAYRSGDRNEAAER